MAKQRQQVSNKSGKFRMKKQVNVKNRQIKSKNGVKKVTRRIQDARQKIIQKKRKTVRDARDIITKNSKVKDARMKINKLRNGGSTARSPSDSSIRIGPNIVKKTDLNGKISLVTTKKSNKPKSNMNLAIQKQLGLIPNSPRSMRRQPTVTKRSQTQIPKLSPMSIRQAALNELDNVYERPPYPFYDPTLYKWTKPDMRAHPASRLINALEMPEPRMPTIADIAGMDLADYEWPTYATHRYSKVYRPFRLQNTEYIDLDAEVDEEMPLLSPSSSMALQGTSRVTDVRSRLDSMPQPESHGIFSQTRAKVVVPAGHRIVVSNLQSSVTQDDIKELFEDIGQLLTAKLVRPGVAEVIYKNLKDAQKAVDTYHNRQLDGQPMKCLLVNKRPLNQPTGAPVKSEMQVRRKITVPPCPPGNKLVPDIDTIHKVLFQRK